MKRAVALYSQTILTCDHATSIIWQASEPTGFVGSTEKILKNIDELTERFHGYLRLSDVQRLAVEL
jgi:hypothetical protein